MNVVYARPLPEAPQLLSMIYAIVSSLLLKVCSSTNHKCVAMHASTSVVFDQVANTALCVVAIKSMLSMLDNATMS